MGLTMRQRQAVTRQVAIRYRSASKSANAVILDELRATTGWHRDHVRKALRQMMGPRQTGPTRRKSATPREPTCGPEVMAALRKVWAVMGAPAGKRMAPFMGEIFDRLRACGELDISDRRHAEGRNRYHTLQTTPLSLDWRRVENEHDLLSWSINVQSSHSPAVRNGDCGHGWPVRRRWLLRGAWPSPASLL